jgi:hypothetical protein
VTIKKITADDSSRRALGRVFAEKSRLSANQQLIVAVRFGAQSTHERARRQL